MQVYIHLESRISKYCQENSTREDDFSEINFPASPGRLVRTCQELKSLFLSYSFWLENCEVGEHQNIQSGLSQCKFLLASNTRPITFSAETENLFSSYL